MMAWALILLPVLLFLGVLLLLDSYRLVRPALLALVFLSGSAATLTACFVNSRLALLTGLSDHLSSRYIAPVVEESLKASILLLLIARGKVGFMIDAALYGFAVGAGFAFAENIFYLTATAEPDLVFLSVRGFGTAIMHCGTTALLGVFLLGGQGAGKKLPSGLIPGFLLAVLIHSAFNHFYLHPLVQTMLVVVMIPVTMAVVFHFNEKQLQKWLELEFFSEACLLAQMLKGEFSESKPGRYLARLKEHFAPETIVDMYCYLSLYLELSVKSKRNLLLSECGLSVVKEPGLDEKRKEFFHLRKRLGKSGQLALSPLLKMKHRDLWKLKRDIPSA